MTLTELRYIVAVARERHFGQAAKSCYVSQPTLSIGIKKLEEELGVGLFERNHKELVVTTIGRKIIDQAEQVLRDVQRIKDLIAQNDDPIKMPLKLGAIHTVGPYLLPSLLPTVRDLAPDLPLIIEEDYTQALIERLHHGDLDAAIVSLPSNEPGLEVQSIYDEPFVIVLPSSHPLNINETISVSQLCQETVLLLGPAHCFRKQVLEMIPALEKSLFANHDLQSALAGGSLETIRHMVASGIGVTILPTTAACAEKYSQRLVTIRRFAGIHPTRRIALVWRKNFPRTVAVRLIAEAISYCGLTGVEMLGTHGPAYPADKLRLGQLAVAVG